MTSGFLVRSKCTVYYYRVDHRSKQIPCSDILVSILQYYSENSVSDDVDITPHVTGETSEYLGRLLIGDDEPRLLNSLCSILRDKGFEVDGAEDGDAVCQRLRENAYDLVLLDIRMPGKSGLEIMAWLKETGVDAPVIIISAHSYYRIVRQAFKLVPAII